MKLPGINTLQLTRAEANESVDKRLRYQQIIEILSESNEPMSAKEIAVAMFNRGFANTGERNLSHPRISEMMKLGIIDCVGYKKCQYTKKTVGIFQLRNGVKNEKDNL